MRTWGPDRRVRARVIRDILRGRLAPSPDPHGLRLRGAVITGRIDLERLTTTVDLGLEACLLDEGVCARNAHLSGLTLSTCRLDHPAEPALNAELVTASVISLSGSVITANGEHGAVEISAAKLTALDCSGTRISNSAGPALRADAVQIEQVARFDHGFRADGGSEQGTVLLLRAHIRMLSCAGAHITNTAGPALVADDLQADEVWLDDGFEASGSGTSGAVRLNGAHIAGELSCSSARIANASGPGLGADDARIGGGALFNGRFKSRGAGEFGAMRLSGAHVGYLACFGARLINCTGPALMAEGIRVDGHAHLTEGFFAAGSGEKGTLRLVGAHIGGELICSGALLVNDSGPALYADGLRVGTVARLDSGFKAKGSGERGTVRIGSAGIGDQLVCTGARLVNDSGPALDADRLHVGGNAYFSQGFSATGCDDHGAVQLLGARIDGQFHGSHARVRNKTGPAVFANHLQVAGDLFLHGTRLSGSGELGALVLNAARIGGKLDCAGTVLDNKTGPAMAAEQADIALGAGFTRDFTARGGGTKGALYLVGARFGGQLDCSGAILRNATGPALSAQDLRVGTEIFLARDGSSGGFRATGGGGGAVLDLTNARIDGPVVFRPSRLANVCNPGGLLRLDGFTYTGLSEGVKSVSDSGRVRAARGIPGERVVPGGSG